MHLTHKICDHYYLPKLEYKLMQLQKVLTYFPNIIWQYHEVLKHDTEDKG